MDKFYPITVVPGTRDETGDAVRIRLEVTGSETIGNLKVRLWDGGLIPRSKTIQSHLVFLVQVLCTGERCLVFDGLCLENGRTLSDYNIQEEETLYLPGQIGAAFLIFIRFPTGETIEILIENINTIEYLKSQIKVEAWVPLGKGVEFLIKTIDQR
jgi:hypothetical protein